MKPDSVDELMQCPDIDGCLVGGASLSSDDFARICSFHQASKPGMRVLYANECLETRGNSANLRFGHKRTRSYTGLMRREALCTVGTYSKSFLR